LIRTLEAIRLSEQYNHRYSQSPKPTSSIEENGGSPRPASDSDRMEICSPKLSPPPSKPLLIEQNASYSITNHTNNIDADARLTPPARLPSPVHQPLPRFEMSPPVTFAARPGVVPGQPIRKNLRWGKGKVTTSRPMVATSPLAGPAAYSGTPTILKTEENTDRQATPPDTKPSLVDPPASFS
jgi:histone-lysine N-methyltransferase SUV420H